MTVKTAVFTHSTNGLRIKSWARPSNGFVRGIVFQDVLMRNVANPIIIDQNYCPHQKNCPDQVSLNKYWFRNDCDICLFCPLFSRGSYDSDLGCD